MSRRLLATLTLSLLATVIHADDKWSVTTSFEMPGMPFNMPPQTHEVCVAPGEESRSKMIPTEDGCKISNQKTTGNTTSFHIDCPAPKKMSGDLKMTYSGSSYNGEMTAQADMGGHPGSMKITYAGKKLGSCAHSENTVVKANKMMAQQQAMMAQQQSSQASYANAACQQLANEMSTQMVSAVVSTCPTIKADICKTFSAKTADPDGLRAFQLDRQDFPDVARFCGLDASAIQTKTCNLAKSNRNWAAAVDLCPADADMESTAMKECTGLNFTSMPQNDPRRSVLPLCSKYAAKLRANNPGGSSGSALDTGKKALENINKLRGLFGH